MDIYAIIIAACWAVFIIIWLFASFATKRSVRPSYTSWGILIRVAILVFVVWAVHRGTLKNPIAFAGYMRLSPPLEALGAAFAIIGIGFAVWARFYLGRNWGMPMSLRAEPELVTTGPYRYVRHPIYTGVLLAMLGSTAISGWWWLIIFAVGTTYFAFSARKEERDMVRIFPTTYPGYRARTKMLIPFIF